SREGGSFRYSTTSSSTSSRSCNCASTLREVPQLGLCQIVAFIVLLLGGSHRGDSGRCVFGIDAGSRRCADALRPPRDPSGALDCADQPRIDPAAAQIGNGLLDFFLARVGVARQEAGGGNGDARRAEPALDRLL